MLGDVDRKLRATPTAEPLLRHRATLLRALGDLDAALAACAGLSDPVSVRARAILAGEAVTWDDSTGPAPFVLIDGFLDAEHQARLWEVVAAPTAEFFAGSIKGAPGEVTDTNLRQAQVMRRAGPIHAWFMPLLEAAASADVLARLGVAPFEPGTRELQVTRHDDGAHLWMHIDIGPAHPLRHLTYIYYFHREPRRFDGGDLLLFDQAPDGKRSDLISFTRIAPLNNRLLLFPPNRLHQVSRVSSESHDPLDARWTVNGWLNRRGDAESG